MTGGWMAEFILQQMIRKLEERIEAAKQRLESLNGQHVGQAEIYAVIEILEGKG